LFSLESFLSDDHGSAEENHSHSLKRLLTLSDAYGFRDWLQLDPSTVRGLSYYTDTVFEVRDRANEFRAIAGGGRYDNLLQTFTGKPSSNVPAVGFGFGDAVIMELLRFKNLVPQQLQQRADVDVVVFSMESHFRPAAMATAAILRGLGLNTDLLLENKAAKAGFSKANNVGASTCNILNSLFLNYFLRMNLCASTQNWWLCSRKTNTSTTKSS
jgi:histidyl-tRNA synthetase